MEVLIRDYDSQIKAGILNLVFELFEDEKFEHQFSHYRCLTILEKTHKKMSESVKQSGKSLLKEEREYVGDALVNLGAFIHYQTYHKFFA